MNYLVGSDLLGAGPTAPEPKTSVFQREAFGGVKVWQVVVGGAGIASILGGVVALFVRRRN